MTLPALREKVVGQFTVRELSMRTLFALQKRFPEADNERVSAMLGAAVYNGSAEPIGDAILDLGSNSYNELLAVFLELNGRGERPEENEGNG